MDYLHSIATVDFTKATIIDYIAIKVAFITAD